MKKLAILLMLIIILAPGLFSQTAVVKQVVGKVEVKAPGQAWVPAKVGMDVSKGSFISTGFRSTAVLEMGPSVLNVRQLTRMQLEELLEKEGTMTTGLYLNVGKVNAKVKSVKGLSHDFKLRSPVSTAAVRGTDFDYDGRILKVREGIVDFINELKQRRKVFDEARLAADGGIETGDTVLDDYSNVSAYAGEAGGTSKEYDAEFYGGVVFTFERP
jgi:hypothetical protein